MATVINTNRKKNKPKSVDQSKQNDEEDDEHLHSENYKTDL
jgi:hypothetical protein